MEKPDFTQKAVVVGVFSDLSTSNHLWKSASGWRRSALCVVVSVTFLCLLGCHEEPATPAATRAPQDSLQMPGDGGLAVTIQDEWEDSINTDF